MPSILETLQLQPQFPQQNIQLQILIPSPLKLFTMTNCSNSFQALFSKRNREHLARPKTHRPQCQPKQLVFIPSTPSRHSKHYQIRITHQHSISKYVLNKSSESIYCDPIGNNKCTTEENLDGEEMARDQQRKKVYKNINKSNKAARPSIPKKFQSNNLSSIALNKIRLVPQLKMDFITPNQKQRMVSDKSTERKKPQEFQFLTVPVEGINMVKTKEIKVEKHPLSNNLHQTIKHLVDYKIAQSKVLFQSWVEDSLKIQESMVDERDPLINFIILKDLESNLDYTEQMGIERHIGLCVSIKRVSSHRIQSISTQKTIYETLGGEHPNILSNYQQLLNGFTSQYIFIREHYDSYLKYELLTKQDLKRYFKHIVLIFHELSRKKIRYPNNIYENMVIARNACKLMNFQNCRVQQCELVLRKSYKVCIRNILEIMINQVVEVDLGKEREFMEFLRALEAVYDFLEILNHKYLIPASTNYMV